MELSTKIWEFFYLFLRIDSLQKIVEQFEHFERSKYHPKMLERSLWNCARWFIQRSWVKSIIEQHGVSIGIRNISDDIGNIGAVS